VLSGAWRYGALYIGLPMINRRRAVLVATRRRRYDPVSK
jgi:hypothetical protein